MSKPRENSISTNRKSPHPAREFSIEFLTETRLHPRHSKIVFSDDYIELGRDTSCLIQFDESFPMVSRRHAAIQVRRQQVVLIHLSATNQTLINGRPVQKEWLLQNGDEIQLAADGPRLHFAEKVHKPSVKFTDRIKVFSERALKPYRYALIGLGIVFVLSAVAAFFFIRKTLSEKEDLAAISHSIEKQLAEQKMALAKGDSALIAERTQKTEALAVANKKSEEFQAQLAALGQKINVLASPRTPVVQVAKQPKEASLAPPTGVNALLNEAKNHLYSLQLFLTIKDSNGEFMELKNGDQQKVIVNNIPLEEKGTGFVLDDGRFVTARRWVEPWVYVRGEDDYLNLFANFIHYNGGRASVKIVATGPKGQQLVFQTHLFTTDLLKDQLSVGDFGFGKGKISTADPESGTDWAVFKGMPEKGLPFSRESSEKDEIYTLGFTNTSKNLVYGKAILGGVSPEGSLVMLQKASGSTNTYGAPALAIINRRPVVIGLVTAQKDGRPAIIPISEIK